MTVIWENCFYHYRGTTNNQLLPEMVVVSATRPASRSEPRAEGRVPPAVLAHSTHDLLHVIERHARLHPSPLAAPALLAERRRGWEFF